MSGPFDHSVAVDGAFKGISIKKKGPGVKQPVSPILLRRTDYRIACWEKGRIGKWKFLFRCALCV